MPLTDIDIVLARLDDVIEEAREGASRAGYFAAMYRKVTVAVRDAVVAGRFADGDRMARLDRVFAERYLDAYDQWRTGAVPTIAWQVAFDATRRWRPIIVQQLLAGMNAHINLDLGVAAASVAPGTELVGLRSWASRLWPKVRLEPLPLPRAVRSSWGTPTASTNGSCLPRSG
jgi:hypothetical protein